MFYTSVTFTFLMADHWNSFFLLSSLETTSLGVSARILQSSNKPLEFGGAWSWANWNTSSTYWRVPEHEGDSLTRTTFCENAHVMNIMCFFYLATKARIISFTQDLNHPLASEDRPKGWGMSEFKQRTLRKSPLTWENQNSPIFQRVGGWATQSNKYESKHESSAFRKKPRTFQRGPNWQNQFRRPVLVGVSSCLCNLNEHIFV